jgi:hypothetical protein
VRAAAGAYEHYSLFQTRCCEAWGGMGCPGV